MAAPTIIDGPIGNADQFLAGIQAQIAIITAQPASAERTATLAALNALAAGLQ